MKRFLFQFILTVPLLLLGWHPARPTLTAQQRKPEKKTPEKPLPLTSHLVLIFVDGLRNEDWQNPKLNLPTLKSLQTQGASVLNLESVYPSQSLPAHATILTGMFPADHGIFADANLDEKWRKTLGEQTTTDLKTATILQLAKQSGLKTAVTNFPLVKEATTDFNSQDFSQTLVWLENNRPQLACFRFQELAMAIQRFGLDSAEANRALEEIDTSLKKIVETIERAGIKNETTLLVVSSHGYAKVQQEFRPNVILAKKGWLTLDGKGNVAEWKAIARSFGGAAAVYLKDAKNEAAVKEVESLFEEVHKSEASPIWRLISRQDAVKLGADPHAAFFIEAAPGFAISEQAAGKRTTEKLSKDAAQAISGYIPSRSEMRGSLLLSGKGIKPQVLMEYAHLVDIAPTIARLLGLELKPARGHALSALFVQPNQK
ncbi:MAG: ectonucleotide pyrophosphatase/phosphodiesterase [Blastocatellia bacterium]